MKITVLIEPMNGTGFRATGGEPFCIAAEGATRELALDKLRAEVKARLNAGAEIVSLDVDSDANPWSKVAGMFKDDPMLEEWKQAMADYRDRVEKDDDYP